MPTTKAITTTPAIARMTIFHTIAKTGKDTEELRFGYCITLL